MKDRLIAKRVKHRGTCLHLRSCGAYGQPTTLECTTGRCVGICLNGDGSH